MQKAISKWKENCLKDLEFMRINVIMSANSIPKEKLSLDKLTVEEEFKILNNITNRKGSIRYDWFNLFSKCMLYYSFNQDNNTITNAAKKLKSGLDVFDPYNIKKGQVKKLRSLVVEELGKTFESYKDILTKGDSIATFIEDNYDKIKNHMKKRLKKNPEIIKEIFLSLHKSDYPLNNRLLDELLTINYEVDEKVDFKELEIKYGEQAFFENSEEIVQTSYEAIRELIHELEPKKKNVIYDLGSGFGRVCFYGGLTTEAIFKGIELVPARVDDCNRIKQKFSIDNAHFIQGNVLDIDFSDGEAFFMYLPFTKKTTYLIFEKLKSISDKKPIKLAFHQQGVSDDNLSWLEKIEVKREDDLIPLEIYMSK